jgi:HAD superfamily hydrolase (TIGR01509 family)
MRWQAVIFDLDGTLLETERLVVEAGLAAFRRLGLPERLDVLTDLIGTVGDDAMGVMSAAFGPAFDPVAFDAAWHIAVEQAFAAGIPLRPGVTELLIHLDRIAMPRAIATNSRTASATANMAAAGIARFFGPSHIHGRDQVARPKPAPDLFLRAARGLSVDPAHCLVFEDSDPGTAAALAAGMTVIHVPDQRPPTTRDAHYIAESLLSGARAAGLLP